MSEFAHNVSDDDERGKFSFAALTASPGVDMQRGG